MKMKLLNTWCVLSTIGSAEVEVLRSDQIGTGDESHSFSPLVNRNGWVNPEDLAPMPQCIAQQDQSAWLNAMTRCTHRQCTRHFGVICTHHQWLTQLSCLSTEFSPDVIKQYFPFCSRSVLAKAQLFQWIQTITGRTWLINVGDAHGLQHPSPFSLTRGYAAVGVTDKAPTCLTESIIESTVEPFYHALASCSFTSDTRHLGNVARPWEYRESQGSIVALDSETAGYDLTLRRIAWGDYFDKRCFCQIVGTNTKTKPCLGRGLDSTRERLWLNATCGPASLPVDWMDGLQTTTFAYIPTENWRWPECVAAMPDRVTRLVDQCTDDACEPDSDGYCSVKPAIDRACFCRTVSYDSCKGPCHVFEAREDFLNWLHSLCGDVAGWHGLPNHWRQLAAPTSTEMIPWRWKLMPSHHHSKTSSTCASTDWKLGSVILINVATSIVALHTWRPKCHHVYPELWFVHGLAIAALQISANWINAALVQASAGYEAISIVELTFLWCSMPRLTWLTLLLVLIRSSSKTSPYTIASHLFSETILQILSAFPMIETIDYGREHGFYSHGMARLEAAPAARFIYIGATMWLVVIVLTLALLLQAARGLIAQPESRMSETSVPIITEQMMDPANKQLTKTENNSAPCRRERRYDSEETPLKRGHGQNSTNYGAVHTENGGNSITQTQRELPRLTLIAITSMLLLWIAQWTFWVGFIDLSLERYCPPELELLTCIWITASVAATVVAMMPRVK